VELQAVEEFIDAQAWKLQEHLQTISSDHLREYNLTDIKAQATINGSRSETEATKLESSHGWK
jgi:hypothetical protein